MKRPFFTFGILLSSLSFLTSQTFQIPSDLETQIDAFYAPWNQGETPGCAVGVVHQGKLVFAKGYGLASLEHQVPFKPETVSDIGSVSKQLTCFGIVLLAQEGKLKLDDDIRKYLPEVPDFGATITIRHLMNHTSGLPDIYATESIRGYRAGDGILQEDALSLVRNLKELNYPPGDQYLYSNTAYMLLTDIISQISKQSFESWMQENIFRPLGMTNTYIMDKRGEVFPNCAASYSKEKDGSFVQIYDNSTVQGAGGVYTTISDLAKWMNNLRDPKLGGKSALEEMMTKGVLNNGKTINYALGINVDTYRGLKRIEHTGSSAGYRTLMSYFPEQDLGFLVKTNCPSVDRAGLVDQLLTSILGAEEKKDTLKGKRTPNSRHCSGGFERLYTGHYFSDELESFYSFELEDGKLMGKHFRHGSFELKAIGPDHFISDNSFFSEVKFFRNDHGNVYGLRVGNGRVLGLWFGKI